MPHFSSCCKNADTWICQVCAKIYCGGCTESVWMEPVPGKTFNGNVCVSCRSRSIMSGIPGKGLPTLSVYEHCEQESGLPLGSAALERYVQRYYGHG